MAVDQIIPSGPVGASTGATWDFNHKNAAINDIVVYADANSFVYGVTLTAIDRKSRQSIDVQTFGISKDKKPNEVSIKWDDDEFTKIKGTTAVVSDPGFADYKAIQSLGFETKKGKTYGPFGKNDGTSFEIPVEDGEIVGFFGRANDSYVTAIGLYVLIPKN